MSISAGVTSYYEKQFNCHDCVSEFKKRQDYSQRSKEYDELLVKKKRLKGCFGSDRVMYKIEDISFKTCIGNLVNPAMSVLMDLYYNYKNGVMPYSGSLMDQPAKIIDVLNLIEACVRIKQNEIEKESQRKAKLNHGKQRRN